MSTLTITKPVGEYEKFLNNILSILGNDDVIERYHAIDNNIVRIGFKEKLINKFGPKH